MADEDVAAEPLLARSDAAPEPQRRKLKKKSDSKKSEHNKKRIVQRSKSGSAVARKTKGRVLRSKSEDDGESTPGGDKLKKMSKATETSSLSSSKRNKRKVKTKAALATSKTRTRSPTTSISPTRRSASPRNSISPRRRRESRSRSPPSEGVAHRPANRRSSLSKLYSWWDLTSKHSKLGDEDGDRPPSPPPPPPPRHPISAQSTNTRTMMRKRSDTELPPPPSPPSRSAKSAIVTKHKKQPKGRKQSFDSIEENDSFEVSKNSLLSSESGEHEDDNSKKSAKKRKNKKKKSAKQQKQESEHSSSNYATLLDSPSTSSMTSTISSQSLKDRLKDAESSMPQVASLGELFDLAQGERRNNTDSDDDDDDDDDDDSVGSFATERHIIWVELSIQNPSNVVISALNEENVIESRTVPADSAVMNVIADDIDDSFRSIGDSLKSEDSVLSPNTTKRKARPSLGETIGRDRRNVQNPPSDERTNCTGETIESERTAKVANHDPRASDTIHEIGFQDLKTGEDDNENDNGDDDGDKQEETSVHSRSSLGSIKSSKSLPTRRKRRNNKEGTTTASSHEPQQRGVRRSNSRRQTTTRTGSREAPRRSRSGRAALRRGSSHQLKPTTTTTATTTTSEIEDFMAMTKEDSDSSPNKEGTDGTLSTTTESTMTTDATMRSRRNSAGALNPTLIQNFQLTF